MAVYLKSVELIDNKWNQKQSFVRVGRLPLDEDNG